MSRFHLVSIAALAALMLTAGCSASPESQETTAAAAAPPSTAPVAITLSTEPDPPVTGDARFTATITSPDGVPVTDASATVELYMPAMPSMNMPEMRHRATLEATDEGRYAATVPVMMAGSWDATVIVSRDGREIARRTFALTAR